MFGISFAVNDNLSISYGQSETSKEGSTIDQELSGFSIGYSMGGMTLKAHKNKGEKLANTANNESEHTEIALSFAF
jgi:outer membrane protein OmpU